MAVAILPGFSKVPGLEGEPELTTAGIIIDRMNVLDGDPIIITEVVIIVVSRLLLPRHGTVILCAKLGDGHC